MARMDIALIFVLVGIAIATLAGAFRIAEALMELSERPVMVQCECVPPREWTR